MIPHISDMEFEEEVLEEEGLVVVDFSAEWCMPCKMLSHVLESISKELQNIKIAKIDVDENPLISRKYKIRSIPTIRLFKNGTLIGEFTGFIPKGKLEKIIKANLWI